MRFIAFLIFSLIYLGVSDLLAENAQYMGTGSCSSSNCHGSTAPRNASSVLQNEYVTWYKHDKHAGAWKILGNEDSQIIAKHLGIGAPHKEALCLGCHATHVENAALRGKEFQIEDGVSCESCHGAAGNWLAAHSEKDSSHAENVKLGLRELVSPGDRARLCLDCHYGSEKNAVTHRLIGAGHPRLSFELDTFGSLEPMHWDVDQDYIERKQDYNPAKTWLAGQTAQAERTLEALLSPHRSKDGLWPELSLMNCYACHHSLKSDQWKSREYKGAPGELRPNISSLLTVRSAMAVVDPAIEQKLSSGIDSMSSSFRSGNSEQVLGDLRAAVAKDAASAVSRFDYSKAALDKLLQAVVKRAVDDPLYQYEDAEQIAMGISALATARWSGKPAIQTEINRMYQALSDAEDFAPENFTQALKELGAKL